MEPTGAETKTILEQLALGFGALQGRADATDHRLDTLHDRVAHLSGRIDRLSERNEHLFGRIDHLSEGNDHLSGRIDHLSGRIDEVHALVITVKEAAELQSLRVDAIDNHLTDVDRRLTARTDNLERRMERGFTRVDERFEVLTAEMRSGFDEVRRSDRRRRPKRDD